MAEIPTGYEDLQAWSQQQNDLLSQQQQLQQNLVNQQVQQSVDQLNYDKQKIDQNVQKQNQGLYTNYQKMANNYGVQAEQRAQMGLANSGYAETSRVNLFNAYQKNVTDTLNSANQLKADFDFQINQARQQGNITLAQNQLALYQQRMQLLSQEYDMKQQQRQFEYQQQRNQIADQQWQQSFDYQKSRDAVSDRQWQQTFDYQKTRDAVADSQWQKQYELSKKAYTSSSRRSSSSRKKSNGGTSSNAVSKSDVKQGANTPSEDTQEVLKRLKPIQGATKDGVQIWKDSQTGKRYRMEGNGKDLTIVEV